MEIFFEHKREIDQHNELFGKGLVTFKMGINKYSDLAPSEFVNLMNGFKTSHLSK